jgi:hypothetical protein
MDTIIGRSLTLLNSARTMGSVRQRDDNSRGNVQNVRGDSSAISAGTAKHFASADVSAVRVAPPQTRHHSLLIARISRDISAGWIPLNRSPWPPSCEELLRL